MFSLLLFRFPLTPVLQGEKVDHKPPQPTVTEYLKEGGGREGGEEEKKMIE